MLQRGHSGDGCYSGDGCHSGDGCYIGGTVVMDVTEGAQW